jgi:membrane-associated phospholipid phosphatase
MVITVWWQISAHAAFAAAVAVFCIALWGPWLAVTAPAVVLVGWARVQLKAHTLAQVIAGTALGAAITTASWALLA